MKINWKVRFNKKNLTYIGTVIVAVVMPVLAYFGLKPTDFTTWASVGSTILAAISNPYVVGMMIVNFIAATYDPTTKGLGDSENALTYEDPKA